MRYSAFLDGNNGFIADKYNKEFKIYRSNVTDTFYTCYEATHKKKRSTSNRSELDELYFESKKSAGKMYDKKLDERMQNIKDILKKNIIARKECNPSSDYDKMLDNLDNYISERRDMEIFNLKQCEKRFDRKFAFNYKKFNYAFTITFDPERFRTSDEWLKSLLRYFGNICFRDKVIIMGAFEFGDENGRIHFHGVGYFPNKFLGNGLQEHKHYSTKRKRWETYFEFDKIRKRFGINQFDPLNMKSKTELKSVLDYISKYVIKNNGRTYYSRGLEDTVSQYIDPKYCFYEFESNGMIKYHLAESFSFEKERFFRAVNSHCKELSDDDLPFDTSD